MSRYRDAQWGKSASGRLLAEDLVSTMRHYVPFAPRVVPRALVRRLAGDRCADLLGIPREPLVSIVATGARWSAQLTSLVEPLTRPWVLVAMEAAIAAQRQGRSASFRIPGTLLGQRQIAD
jgi:hypothetical protein